MFVVCVCADLNGIKHNLEVAFPLKPTMEELKDEVERLFELEQWMVEGASAGDGDQNLRRNVFTVKRFLMYSEATKRWSELQLTSQLKAWAQLYAVQEAPSRKERERYPTSSETNGGTKELKDAESEEGREDAAWYSVRRRREREAAINSAFSGKGSRVTARSLRRETEKGEAPPSPPPPAPWDALKETYRAPEAPSGPQHCPKRRMSPSRNLPSLPESPRTLPSPAPQLDEQALLRQEARIAAQRRQLQIAEQRLQQDREEFIARTGRLPGGGTSKSPADGWEVYPFPS